MLCVLLLPTHTTANEIIKSLNNSFTGKLNWFFCIAVCRDGAAAMTEQLSCLTICIKEFASGCEFKHYVIHREMLASRKMPPKLYKVLNNVVKIINHVKTSSFNTRLFEQLCEKIDAEQKCLLLHIEVRWLFREKLLNKVFELREPLQRFVLEKKSHLADNNFNDKI